VRQGLVLFILEVILTIFGWILFILLPIAWIVVLVFTIMGILNVVNKKEAELPLIGQFAKYFHNV
jgi:energy-converting hydrogenase Eha subunit G